MLSLDAVLLSHTDSVGVLVHSRFFPRDVAVIVVCVCGCVCYLEVFFVCLLVGGGVGAASATKATPRTTAKRTTIWRPY